MTREEAIELLKGGKVEEWNKWRESGEAIPEFRGVTLHNADLSGANLRRVNLVRANLSGANLSFAYLNGANLSWADLRGADLLEANLRRTNLSDANLSGANLNGANLSWADLKRANFNLVSLYTTNLSEADLCGASFENAVCLGTVFNSVDLSVVHGLKETQHSGPSELGTHTLTKSGGKIPEEFLKKCGLQQWEIEQTKLYQPGLSAAEITDIQYRIFDLRTGPLLSGCFVSYSHNDSDFVEVLYKRLREEGGSVWLDKHNFVAGPLEKNVDRAIRLNDIVVLVLSKSSLSSDWVWDEIESACEKESQQKREVICPIAVDDAWKSDQPEKRFLMRKIKRRIILDFSDWQTPTGDLSEKFRTNYRRLVDGMKIHYGETREAVR